MLTRFLQLRTAIHAVCQLEDILRPYSLSDHQWKLLERLKDVMEIFVKATQYLSSSSYPTLSAQLPYFSVLATRLENLADEYRTAGSDVELLAAITKAWQKLDEYHCKTGAAQAIATILDPRCKLATFRNLSWREEWIQEAQESIYRIYAAQYAPTNSINQSRPATPDPFEGDGLEDDFLEAVFGSQSSAMSINAPSELELYLEEPPEARTVKPIEWWRTYASKYPHLALMARDFLAIPATSVPSEQVFSIAGMHLSFPVA